MLIAQIGKLRNDNDYLYSEILRIATEVIEAGPKKAQPDGAPGIYFSPSYHGLFTTEPATST